MCVYDCAEGRSFGPSLRCYLVAFPIQFPADLLVAMEARREHLSQLSGLLLLPKSAEAACLQRMVKAWPPVSACSNFIKCSDTSDLHTYMPIISQSHKGMAVFGDPIKILHLNLSLRC